MRRMDRKYVWMHEGIKSRSVYPDLYHCFRHRQLGYFELVPRPASQLLQRRCFTVEFSKAYWIARSLDKTVGLFFKIFRPSTQVGRFGKKPYAKNYELSYTVEHRFSITDTRFILSWKLLKKQVEASSNSFAVAGERIRKWTVKLVKKIPSLGRSIQKCMVKQWKTLVRFPSEKEHFTMFDQAPIKVRFVRFVFQSKCYSSTTRVHSNLPGSIATKWVLKLVALFSPPQYIADMKYNLSYQVKSIHRKYKWTSKGCGMWCWRRLQSQSITQWCLLSNDWVNEREWQTKQDGFTSWCLAANWTQEKCPAAESSCNRYSRNTSLL